MSDILDRVTEYDLWCYYLQQDISFGKRINSPVRDDFNPSASFYMTKDGHVMFLDFSTGEAWNIWKFLKFKYNESFKDILKRIDYDFKLGLWNHSRNRITTFGTIGVHRTVKLNEGETKYIKVKRKKWEQNEIDFWKEYHIELDTLNFYKVAPLEKYWVIINGETYEFKRLKDELMFVFSFGNARYKIYRPFGGKDSKWYSNTPSDTLMGYDMLPWIGESIIITKGMKEMCLLHQLGYNSVSLQSENCWPNNITLETIKKRFGVVYCMFDMDKHGLRASDKMSNHFGVVPIKLPEEYYNSDETIKDFAEIVRLEGLENGRNIIAKCIHNTGECSIK